MGGGLMQLVAYGAQDIYLTGNPQITFFKVVYRRHTNFAVESIEQTINGSVGDGSKVSVTVARNGDLLHRIYLQVKRDTKAAGETYTSRGFNMVDYVEVEVGGQVIDKHYGQWMKIWCDLTHPLDKKEMLNTMLCDAKDCVCAGTVTSEGITVVPFQFWFCRNPGLALPLIALQYHEVKLNIKMCNSLKTKTRSDDITLDTPAISYTPAAGGAGVLANTTITVTNNGSGVTATVSADGGGFVTGDTVTIPGSLVGGTDQTNTLTLTLTVTNNDITAITVGGSAPILNSTKLNAEVWCDYIFLDTDERRRFAQVSHEYLIEQVQYNNGVQFDKSVQTELRFNHPVKELIWQSRGTGACCNTTAGTSNVCSALLQLNGHDRFRKRTGEYFKTVQRYEHHSGSSVNLDCVNAGDIYMYSFALKPEEHQPSGTCNFSRIDNAVLHVDKTGSVSEVLDVYAINYNVLRIMSGMGGLAYSN